MNAKQIEIGAIYRHRTSSVGYAQAVKVIPPKTPENPTTRALVKCAWASSPTFDVFMYKHFQPRDLIRHNVELTGTQKEHREVALAIRAVLLDQFPALAEVLP